MNAKIAKALHEVMQKCSYVQRTGYNKFHQYKYAGEADLLAVLRPAMIEAGLVLLPSVVECRPIDEHGNTTVIVEYTLVHKDGDVWPHPIRIAGTGNDKNSKGGIGDKGTYKALTGANKYLLFKLFQIETGDDPEHDASGEDQPAAPQAQGAPSPRLAQRPQQNGSKPAVTTQANDEAAETYVSQSIETIKKMKHQEALAEWWRVNKKYTDRLEASRPQLYDKLFAIYENMRLGLPHVTAGG